MRALFCGFLIVAFTGAWAVADTAAPAYQWGERLAAGQRLEIDNLNGPVTVQRAAGDRVAVTALRTADRSDPNSVQIRVEHDSEGVILCPVYPQDDGSDQTCRHNGGSRSNDRDSAENDTRVSFTVQLPAGVAATLRTVNGSIEVNDVSSPIDAASVNGHVYISTSSYAQAKTVQGVIRVAMGSPSWPSGGLTFASVNGAIDITLPRSADAQIHAKTLNGLISSAVPLNMRRGQMRIMNYADGTVGSGKSRLTITTLNGSIRVERAP